MVLEATPAIREVHARREQAIADLMIIADLASKAGSEAAAVALSNMKQCDADLDSLLGVPHETPSIVGRSIGIDPPGDDAFRRRMDDAI